MKTRSVKVREIFDQAAEITSEQERSTFLNAACAGDTDLRSQVEALLKAYFDAGSFLDRPALDEIVANSGAQTEAFESSPSEAGPHLTPTQVDSVHGKSATFGYLAAPTTTESIGRLEHYEVLEVIGKGGFGTVFKANDTKLRRIVAIKVLAPELAANGSARKRFIREAQTAAAVKNEHVVAIHSVEDEAQLPFLVMEIIDGISLQDKLDKKGPLSLKEILRIGMQAAEGLAAAHKQGLVHRDIKPANILLENGVERVKITDFGLARAVDDASVTQSGTVAGTPMYMSPEQAEGLPVDHRSDLFSFGTVLYAMCTGHPPFRASGTHAVLKRVIDASPRPIREINNEIPDWLCDIIAKLHTKKPEDRFQTAKEVAELLGHRLADLQAGRVIQAEPSRAGDPTKAPVARWRRVVRVLPLVVVGVLFTYGSVLLVTGNPYRTQSLAVAVLAAVLVLADFFVLRSLGWRRRAAALLFLFVIAFGSSELTGLSRVFYAPSYPVALTSDDTGTRVRIWRWAEPTPPKGLGGDLKILGEPLVTLEKLATSEIDLPYGSFLLVADIDGQEGDRQFISVGHTFFRTYHKLPGTPWGGGLNMSAGIGGLGDRTNQRPIRYLTIKAAANLAKLKQRKHQPAPAPVEPGWVQLFNGNDLAGWKTHMDQPGNWRIKDGLLTCDGPQSHLFSERDDFANFHLRAHAKINKDGDSGICFRTPFMLMPQGNTLSYEAQIRGTATGSLEAPNPATRVTVKDTPIKPDEWFVLEVIAQGNQLTIKVNGKTTASASESDKNAFKKGHIALQYFGPGTVIHFSKIEIKESPPTEPSWVQLFNGKDLDGWQGDVSGWKVAEKTLAPSAQARSIHIIRVYENYDLRLQYRRKAGDFAKILLHYNGGNEGPSGKYYELALDDKDKGAPRLLRVGTDTTSYNELPLETAPGPEWNELRIVSDADKLTVHVNGRLRITATGCQPRKGFIGLSHLRGQTTFRDIRIADLRPSPAPALQPLFNGKDLTGWISYQGKSYIGGRPPENNTGWFVNKSEVVAKTESFDLSPNQENLQELRLAPGYARPLGSAGPFFEATFRPR